ncbi:MAG: DUF2332 family protein [Rubrivivax sp.]|nr:DUF2332 family protein [Rubrivivax sp.]
MTPLLAAFARQQAWCEGVSPFTARLLARGQIWLSGNPEAHAVLAAVASDPLAAAVALRWVAALHHLALRGCAPWADLWPPAPAGASDAALDGAIAMAWQTQRSHLGAALALPPQTNEVQRSAALLPGLLHVAASTGLPLALLEIGASAGLNLWCDRYRHEHGAWQWGHPDAALHLRAEWLGPPPPLGVDLRILRRAACDAHPVDIAQPAERLRLASFIWPDQADRLARLAAAQPIAAACMAAEGMAVQALPAVRFLAEQLAPAATDGPAAPDVATVVMHSVVWQYIPAAEQAAITALLDAAGRLATAAQPLAWLRFEPPAADEGVELRCRLWPDGRDRLLARAHAHVQRIEWLAGGAAA